MIMCFYLPSKPIKFINISRFEAPVLRASGMTPMGEGIRYALEEVRQRCHLYHQMGIECFKPFVMMITDGIPTDDVSVEVGESFSMAGSFRPAKTAADALVLQYYEEPDPVKASFGHPLTEKEWTAIGRLKNIGIHTLLHLPTVSAIYAHPMLETMQEELGLEGRKFTFLCGHDINVAAVLSALGAEDYDLPKTIEPETPIGVKFVIEKRRGEDGQAYAALNLVYQSTEQIRNREMLSLEHPPVVFPLHLKGLQMNEDGLYLFADLEKRFLETMEDYDALMH